MLAKDHFVPKKRAVFRALVGFALVLVGVMAYAGFRPASAGAEGAAPSPGTTNPGQTDQCVACHTDKDRLTKLTPPEPAAAGETGEG